MRHNVPPRNRAFAKSMRADSTKVENMLWQALRNKQLEGYKFKRQVPIENHIVDLVCFEARLIVDLDGSQHAESRRDRERDICLAALGFRTLRFWNHEVVENIDGACTHILAELRNTGL